ncbi:Snf11p NDAI_0A03640 [Naumovozyma dairenensis CBS 421]|uniref:Uncharacterized protein n=1 Tax=Naumovozyma dairenensis (strain ATCC 10597 / BCRC 20456 / CBS 421 / NBRC 0211 / NRRL Y-12639) TaxID=1071378 RepID=G0W3Y3_NAUDC|nr:hypothetical protein NDAI_0A03640 [Naumovozyma dairenensis CBS 421]CCD22521.1 hypothetical protein NDAI_0A03640 [Naumovozyma dairenensis CBS 421]
MDQLSEAVQTTTTNNAPTGENTLGANFNDANQDTNITGNNGNYNPNSNTNSNLDANLSTNVNSNVTSNPDVNLNAENSAQKFLNHSNSTIEGTVTLEEQRQYKVQLLLHINSVLILRVMHMRNSLTGNTSVNQAQLQEVYQAFLSQYLKRVHANLQCISQINQGIQKNKPAISDSPPVTSTQQGAHDVLVKLYLLMNRVFEIW